MAGWGFPDICFTERKKRLLRLVIWKQGWLLEVLWGHRQNHLKWLLDNKCGVSSRKRDESQQQEVPHELSLKTHTYFFHSALWSLFPKLSAVTLPGDAPVAPYIWNALHFCRLKPHPFFGALFKLCLLQEGFPDCLWRHKCCFSVASLGLLHSSDHILVFTIVLSMAVSEVHPLVWNWILNHIIKHPPPTNTTLSSQLMLSKCQLNCMSTLQKTVIGNRQSLSFSFLIWMAT